MVVRQHQTMLIQVSDLEDCNTKSYVDIAKEELNLTDKETEFLVKYAESRKKSSKQREQKAFDKRSASGQMGGDMSMGGYLKRMVSKLKK